MNTQLREAESTPNGVPPNHIHSLLFKPSIMKNTLLSLFFVLFSFGLSAQSATEDLRVFPNPVTSYFEIGHSDRVTNVRVINMAGKEVKQFDFRPKETYNIAELPAGMYLVQLRDAADKVVHTQRVKKN